MIHLSKGQKMRRRKAVRKAEQAAQLLKEDKPVLNPENILINPVAQLLEENKHIMDQEITEKTSTNDILKPESVVLGISNMLKKNAAQSLEGDKPILNQKIAELYAQLLKKDKPVPNEEIMSLKSKTTPVVAKDDLPNSAPKSIKKNTKMVVEINVAPPADQMLTKDTESKKSINNMAASDMQTVSTIRPRFSLKDSDLGVQIQAIALHFRNEIKIFQQHLNTLHCSTNTEPCFLTAKIFCSHNKSISTETFNLIQEEIVGWIGKYQYHGMDTPIFHRMTNNGTNVTIVCENLYAYECLEKSVVEIEKLKLLPYLISIEKMPPVLHLLHCYGAIYKSIIGDPDFLLTQINLHRPALEANHWIVVSHEVFHEEQETHSILLLDEQSALALTFHFNNKLLICLNQLKFTARGHVSAVAE